MEWEGEARNAFEMIDEIKGCGIKSDEYLDELVKAVCGLIDKIRNNYEVIKELEKKIQSNQRDIEMFEGRKVVRYEVSDEF